MQSQATPVTTIMLRTAGVILHHDAGVFEALAHDSITTGRDWRHLCRQLRGLGAVWDADPNPVAEDEYGWMTWTGIFGVTP